MSRTFDLGESAARLERRARRHRSNRNAATRRTFMAMWQEWWAEAKGQGGMRNSPGPCFARRMIHARESKPAEWSGCGNVWRLVLLRLWWGQSAGRKNDRTAGACSFHLLTA